jgi:hypothetical protein
MRANTPAPLRQPTHPPNHLRTPPHPPTHAPTQKPRISEAHPGKVPTHPFPTTQVRLTLDTHLGSAAGGSRSTLEALHAFQDQLQAHDVHHVRAVATAAVRAAGSSAAGFLAAATAALGGHRVEVLSGEEEARLTFLGATHGLGSCRGGAAAVVLVDCGGRSTEFAIGGAPVVGEGWVTG